MAVYLNNVFFSSATLHNPGTAGNATIGRLGFYSTTSDMIDMVVDNVLVGAIPEPPAAVVLGLREFSRNDAGLELTYALPQGFLYQLEFTDDLTAATWEPLGAPVPGPADGEPHTFYVSETGAQAFFRIRQVDP